MTKDNGNIFFENIINCYIEKKNRFPTLEKMITFLGTEEAGEYRQGLVILKSLGEKVKPVFDSTVIEIMKCMVERKSQVRGKTILKGIFSKNKEDFIKFFQMNLVRDVENSDFNTIGEIIKRDIDGGAEELVKTMEGGSKYSKFSSSTADSYFKNVKLYFPYIDFVGVKIRKAEAIKR